MPLIIILRALFSILSLVILAAAAYLLWDWYHPEVLRDAQDNLHVVEEPDWKLWAGLGLALWSFFGWLPIPFLLASGDTDSLPRVRGASVTLPSSTGAQLHLETFGAPDAPVIILTHGWGLDRTIWGYAVRDLAPRFRVITWDLPGLGKSKLNSPDLSLSGFAIDLLAIIKSLGGRSAVLVGHSIGGMTIQTLARDHPEVFAGQITGVVLLNTTYTNPLRTMILPHLMQALRRPVIEPMMYLTIWLEPLAWLSAWQSYLSGTAHLANRIGFGRHVTRSQLDYTTLLTTKSRPGVQAKGNLAMFNWDATGAVARTGVPVLVVAGDMDIVTKPDASRVIHADTPSSELQIVEGVNHMGFLERREDYNDAIASFATTVQANAIGNGTPLRPGSI